MRGILFPKQCVTSCNATRLYAAVIDNRGVRRNSCNKDGFIVSPKYMKEGGLVWFKCFIIVLAGALFRGTWFPGREATSNVRHLLVPTISHVLIRYWITFMLFRPDLTTLLQFSCSLRASWVRDCRDLVCFVRAVSLELIVEIREWRVEVMCLSIQTKHLRICFLDDIEVITSSKVNND